MSTGTHFSVPKQFTTGDAVEWFRRFELCSIANGWDEKTKTAKLPTLLEGEALATWLELDEDVQKEYVKVKEKMVENLMPTEFVTLDHFHQRKLVPGESLSVFIHDLKKMLEHAMPKIDGETRNGLLLHQLMAGEINKLAAKSYGRNEGFR